MSIQTVEISLPESIIKVVEIRQGPAGPGGGGTNSVTSATTSDGTADLDLLNVETVTATVTGTLTAPHIHGNLAGSVYAHIRAGEALEKGDPVYVSGSHGSGSTLIPIVSRADASNAAKMPAIGIMDEDVANNANGHMVIVGTITELNTTGLTVNAELYVAAGGGMTATPPTARAQPVARVERVNANNGAVIVKVNGLSASDATGNTLVRRTSGGGASLSTVTLSGTGGSPFTSTLTGGVNFANRTLALPDRSGTLVTADDLANSATITASTSVTVNTIVLRDSVGAINITSSNVTGGTNYESTAGWTYAGSSASAHRIALGAGTTGTALFGAATAAAARTTLGFDAAVPKIPIVFSNSSDFLTASTSFVDVTGLSFPVAANKNYQVVFHLNTNKNDANGIQYRITGPASPNKVFGRVIVFTSSTSTSNADIPTAFSSASTTFNTFNGDSLAFSSPAIIVSNGANAGTIQIQIRAVTGGTAKIYAGSWLQITEL